MQTVSSLVTDKVIFLKIFRLFFFFNSSPYTTVLILSCNPIKGSEATGIERFMYKNVQHEDNLKKQQWVKKSCCGGNNNQWIAIAVSQNLVIDSWLMIADFARLVFFPIRSHHHH